MRIWIRHFVRWDYKNMLNQFSRTELLLGKAAMERLAECRVAVFGIGGVGGYGHLLPQPLYLPARNETTLH